MEIKMKVLALAAITVIGLAMPLGAQTSNQSEATAGVFGTDVDNYMNVNYYDEVNFNKWFGFVGGNTSGIFNLGYATKLKDIYLGGFYTGNVLRTNTDETTRLTTTWDPSLQQMLTRVDEKTYTRTTTNTNNNIAALVGLTGLNMGIKVGFLENITTYNTPYNAGRNGGVSTVTQNADGSITYSNNDSLNYEESSGDLIPYLEWGMKLKVGSYTLTPRVAAAVNFFQDKLIDKFYGAARTEYNGIIAGQERIDRSGRNNGYTALGIGVGADFYLNENMYVGLDYILGMNIYSQSLGDAGRSGSVSGTINWTSGNNYSTIDKYIDRIEKYNTVEITVNERSHMSHEITPSFWKEWKDNVFGENVKLGVLVKLPITITSGFASNYTDRWQTTETIYTDANYSQNNITDIDNNHTAGNLTETSNFSISPTVGVGVSFDLIPKKFTVNAGIKVNVPTFASTSVVTSGNGVNSHYTKTEIGFGSNKYTSAENLDVTPPTTVTDSVQTTTSWTGLSGSIAGGFLFNFNDNFALDMLFNYGSGFDIDIYEWNVLFSIKF